MYRILKNLLDKGILCVVVYNLENFIIFDGICFFDFGILINMEKKMCEIVLL